MHRSVAELRSLNRVPFTPPGGLAPSGVFYRRSHSVTVCRHLRNLPFSRYWFITLRVLVSRARSERKRCRLQSANASIPGSDFVRPHFDGYRADDLREAYPTRHLQVGNPQVY